MRKPLNAYPQNAVASPKRQLYFPAKGCILEESQTKVIYHIILRNGYFV